VIGVLVLGIVGSIAVAAPKGGGGGSSDSNSSDSTSRSGDVRFERRGPARHLSDLAKELGITTTQLREALDAVRDDIDPPARPPRGERPSRAEIEKRCIELTDALAKELNKSGDEVRTAMKNVAKAKIEEAVDDNRLTRAQADRMIERINDSECVGPLGGPGGRGCHGGPGGGRFHGPPPGDRERPAAPPSNGGNAASLAL
jgi:hypothetical protein